MEALSSCRVEFGWCTELMENNNIYHGFRFPRGIISHAVWLYHRFTLSFRDVEELLASRGIEVTYESIR